MNDQPVVSIVTPSLNHVEFIEDTIQSVLNQDYPAIEYLIIDGGSKDGTIDIIRKFSNSLAYWESKQDRGQSHAINKGLQRSTGQILGWLNSDDILKPSTVSRVVRYFKTHPQIDTVYGNADRINADGKFVRYSNQDLPEFGPKTLINECFITQPGAFWRRGIMEKVGFLTENLHYVMDYEYWARMVLAGANFAKLPGPPVAEFRLSDISKTVTSFDQFGFEKLMVLDQLLSTPDLNMKLGLTLKSLNHQARRARALAYIKIFRASAQKNRQTKQSLLWLKKALIMDPSVLIVKYKVILFGIYQQIRS
jgi:glycosyltransferase involved in cell wall biosynthesis